MIATPSAENSKDYVTLFAFFAWAYYYNGDMKKAYYMLDKALELDSSDTNALYDYGRWLLYDRKYKKCVKYCKEVIKHVPSEVFPYVLLGKAYYHMNQLQLAEQMFSNASRFDAKLKVFADIAHMHDMYGGYKSVNAAWVGVLEKYEYKLGDEYCVRGIVSNSGMDVAAKVSVIVRLYDEKGSILEQKAIEILPRNLNPEQYAFFVADFKYSCTISRSEIEINWSEKYLPQYILNKAEDLEAFRLR
jgi:tetratricopeptide (TPR) repeat protein